MLDACEALLLNRRDNPTTDQDAWGCVRVACIEAKNYARSLDLAVVFSAGSAAGQAAAAR